MIRTRGLSYRYATGGTAPLRFPDVDLRQGGTLLLRGRSGSGKSTWLSLIAGLRGASGGDLFVAGTQLGTQRGAEMDAWRARSIGFLPQKLHLSSALTVADNLALVYFAAGLPRDDAAITRALAQVGEDARTRALGQQIDAYFRGELKDFDVPLDLVGTPFQQSVWQALLNIPYGQTRSYAQQAATIGRPTAVRAVAAANGQNKVSIIVPCHRVIGSSGQLTGYGGGLPRKQWLLGLERGETDLLPLPPAGEGGG